MPDDAQNGAEYADDNKNRAIPTVTNTFKTQKPSSGHLSWLSQVCPHAALGDLVPCTGSTPGRPEMPPLFVSGASVVGIC